MPVTACHVESNGQGRTLGVFIIALIWSGVQDVAAAAAAAAAAAEAAARSNLIGRGP